MDPARYRAERRAMVDSQLAARGISDRAVLEAMASVPREEFVPQERRPDAYSDRALGIGEGQTISQPWIVAAIAEALELDGTQRVLEVGSGSGYSTAVLARLAAEVIGLERIPSLAEEGSSRLREQGVANASIRVADGSIGQPEGAPYDRIAVHAAMPHEPVVLLRQLGEGGLLVGPLSGGGNEALVAWRRRAGTERSAAEPGAAGPTDADYERRTITACRFVPLIGAEGFER